MKLKKMFFQGQKLFPRALIIDISMLKANTEQAWSIRNAHLTHFFGNENYSIRLIIRHVWS